MTRVIYIKKKDGTTEAFNNKKLRESLRRSGASPKLIGDIIGHIDNEIQDGVTTDWIYRHAFQLLNRYADKKYRSWFVGLAPINNPRIVVAVMVDEPSNGKYYGGLVAAPVFSAVMADALRMLSIPQDAPNNNVVIPADVVDVKEVV